jgi:deaminated glutathione amidase
MRVALAQLSSTTDKSLNRRQLADLTRQAAEQGGEVVVFPEETMYGPPDDGPLDDAAEALDGPFVELAQSLARQHGIAILAGMHERTDDALRRPYNTIIVVDRRGSLIGAYRKLHVFDALGYKESTHVLPGDRLPTIVELGDLRIGILNCYDIRFPELARLLVDEGAEVLAVSAAWFGGSLKEDHWETLLRARAIENTCWVAASDQAGSAYVGRSMLIDPMGVVRCSLGEEPYGVVVGDLAPARTAHVRGILPVLENRRLAVSARLRPPAASVPEEPALEAVKR